MASMKDLQAHFASLQKEMEAVKLLIEGASQAMDEEPEPKRTKSETGGSSGSAEPVYAATDIRLRQGAAETTKDEPGAHAAGFGKDEWSGKTWWTSGWSDKNWWASGWSSDWDPQAKARDAETPWWQQPEQPDHPEPRKVVKSEAGSVGVISGLACSYCKKPGRTQELYLLSLEDWQGDVWTQCFECYQHDERHENVRLLPAGFKAACRKLWKTVRICTRREPGI